MTKGYYCIPHKTEIVHPETHSEFIGERKTKNYVIKFFDEIPS